MSSLALSFPAPWPQSCYSFPDADGSASHSSHSLQPALRRSSLLLSLMLLTGQLVQVSDSRQVQVLLLFLAPPLKRTRHVPARSQASLIANSLHGGSHFLPSVVRVFVVCSAIHATLSSCHCPFHYFTFEQISPSAGPAGRRARRPRRYTCITAASALPASGCPGPSRADSESPQVTRGQDRGAAHLQTKPLQYCTKGCTTCTTCTILYNIVHKLY